MEEIWQKTSDCKCVKGPGSTPQWGMVGMYDEISLVKNYVADRKAWNHPQYESLSLFPSVYNACFQLLFHCSKDLPQWFLPSDVETMAEQKPTPTLSYMVSSLQWGVVLLTPPVLGYGWGEPSWDDSSWGQQLEARRRDWWPTFRRRVQHTPRTSLRCGIRFVGSRYWAAESVHLPNGWAVQMVLGINQQS